MRTKSWYIIVATTAILAIAYLVISILFKGNEKLPVYSTLTDKSDLTALIYTNQSGNDVTMNAYKGKIMVVDFIFTHCPTICPDMTANMRGVQEAHSDAEDLHFLSFSVDPVRDSVPRLQYFAGLFEADTSNWHFFTGDKKDIYRIAREGFTVTALEGDGGTDDFIHSPIFVLLDRETNLRGFYDGTDTAAVRKLTNDINQLL